MCFLKVGVATYTCISLHVHCVSHDSCACYSIKCTTIILIVFDSVFC